MTARPRIALSVVALVGVLAGVGHSVPAAACSCVPARAVALSPHLQALDVPRNARVRAYVPSGPDAGRLILRQRKGDDVTTSERRARHGDVDLVELLPAGPLAAATSYEILVRRGGATPPNTVIGFFTTGADTDATPPKLEAASATVVTSGGRWGTTTCGVRHPYVDVAASGSDDRGLPLLFGIWVAKHGRFSLDELPDAIGTTDGLTLGSSTLCSFADYTFAAGGGAIAISVAALDSAGNPSRARRFDLMIPPKPR